MTDIIQEVFDDGLRGAGMVLLLVLAYKIYKMKLHNEIESNCCKGFKWKLQTDNPGGNDNELDFRPSANV